SISEFPLANPAAFPEGIASYGGYVWFVENVAGQVGRVNGDGSISEFPIPTGASLPMGLAPGPDGNLWFTESADVGNALGRVSAIVDYQLTTAASPVQIVSGPDGNLWFGEPILDAVGRFGVDGSYQEFPVDHLAIENTITVGPDSHIWFTGFYGNDVANVPT